MVRDKEQRLMQEINSYLHKALDRLVFLQNYASPSRPLATRKSKNAPIPLFHQAQPLQNHGNRDKGKESGFPGCKLIDLDDCFARGSMHLLFSRLAGRTQLN